MASRADWGRVLFIAALAVVCANVLVFAARLSNPLPMSDEWVYLDSFVRKAASHDLSLFDFFVKRSAMDHANPLRRLVLLMHYEWFGLDYGVQGLVGVLFAFANIGLLWRIAAPENAESRRARAFLVGFLAIASVYLSLNASMIYTWPLLTMAFSNQFFVLLCILQAWTANTQPSRRSASMLLGIAFAMNLVADDTALLASVAIAIATLAWQVRGEERQPGIARASKTVLLPLGCAYVAYKALYMMVTKGAVIAAPLSDRLSLGNKLNALVENLPALLAGLHVPLVAALMQKARLVGMFGQQAHAAEWILAMLMLGAHAWFWWYAIARRTGRAGFAAMVLMLYFYGALAGILVGRASLYGAQYFWQPRYAFLYQLSIVALLLMAIEAMFAARLPAAGTRRAFLARAVPVACACALLLLQCGLSAWTWSGARYSVGFQKKLARQIGELAAHPERAPGKCVPALIVCKYPVGQRRELVAFLKDNELNVFAPSFQARYGLDPGK